MSNRWPPPKKNKLEVSWEAPPRGSSSSEIPWFFLLKVCKLLRLNQVRVDLLPSAFFMFLVDGCPAKLGGEDSRRQPRLGGGRRDEPSHRHSQSPGGFFWSKKKHARSDKMKSFYVYFVSYNKCTSTTEGVVIGWKIHRQGCPETTLSVVQSFSSGDLSFSRAPQSSPLDDKTWVAQDRGETLPRSITRTKPGDKS